MRLILCVLLAGCASAAPYDTTPQPTERVTVSAAPPVATQRLLAAFGAANIPIVSADAATVTTAPVERITMTADGVTGAVEYFIRGSVTGDSTSSVALTLWARAVTPASAREQMPEAARCAEVPKCAAALARMRGVAAGLRE